MLSYCLKCKEDTDGKNSGLAKTKREKTMLLSKCKKSLKIKIY